MASPVGKPPGPDSANKPKLTPAAKPSTKAAADASAVARPGGWKPEPGADISESTAVTVSRMGGSVFDGGAKRKGVSFTDGSAPAGGLPAVLFNADGKPVEQGGKDAAGDSYCGHVAFALQLKSREPGSTIARNAVGEPLVGFLHVPIDHYAREDEHPYDGPPYTQEQRQGQTRQVVGAALRGYVSDAIAAKPNGTGPVKILISGFGDWPERNGYLALTNNPAHDFISHGENIDAAMALAFGDKLLSPKGTPVGDGAQKGLQYAINVAGATRAVIVRTQPLEVDDTAIDPKGGQSIQHAIDAFGPDAVLSLGVNSVDNTKFIAEVRAHDEGLTRTADGAWRGDQADEKAPERQKFANFSLAKAIYQGEQLARADRAQSPGVLASAGRPPSGPTS